MLECGAITPGERPQHQTPERLVIIQRMHVQRRHRDWFATCAMPNRLEAVRSVPRLTLPGLLKSRKVTDLWRRRGTARTSSAATLHAQNDPRTLAQSFASLEWVSFPAHFSVELGIGGAYQSKVAHIALADTPR
jgi:predicted anti-sigma-YlaC factor YlaD